MGVSSSSRASGESPSVRGAVPSLGDEVAGPKAGVDRFGGGVCNAVEGGRGSGYACMHSHKLLPKVTLWVQVTSTSPHVSHAYFHLTSTRGPSWFALPASLPHCHHTITKQS